MSKMNGPTRKKLYEFLCNRDGEYCKCCGKLPREGQLVVDHRDNNNENNNPENHQLLCRQCNYLKNPRRPVDECVSEEETHDQSELEVSRLREPFFRKYAYHLVNEQKTVPEIDIINSGAEHVSISPVTAKRYLNKMCSSIGLLERKHIGKSINIQYKDDLGFS